MRQLRSPYIHSALASLVNINLEIWVISSLMEMGSLRRILDTFFPEGIPEAAISSIVSDCLKGLSHLHERGIVHRAVQVPNCVSHCGKIRKLSKNSHFENLIFKREYRIALLHFYFFLLLQH